MLKVGPTMEALLNFQSILKNSTTSSRSSPYKEYLIKVQWFWKRILFKYIPDGVLYQIWPMVVVILYFKSTQKIEYFVSNHQINNHVQLWFWFLVSQFFFFNFPMQSNAKTMSCYGGHLGFPTHIKKYIL
jgi:hypothetical protein